MNILIIDDGLLPFCKDKSPNKKALLRFALANSRFNRELAKAFSAFSHNVLLVTSSEEGNYTPKHFDYSGEDGFLLLKAAINFGEDKSLFHSLKYYEFCKLLNKNSAALSALFKPDVVLCSGVFPFSLVAAKKLAEISGAVLTAVLSCSYGSVIKSLGLISSADPVLTVFKRRADRALLKCDAVFGYYPQLPADFPSAVPLVPPHIPINTAPSAEAILVHDSIAAFSGGEVFTLCYCGKLAPNLSMEALISAIKGCGKRFILAIVGSGEYKSTLRRIAREQGVTEVCFYDGVPDEDIPFVLSAADSVFIAENSLCKGHFAEYSTFLQVFSAKRPTIAAAEKNADFIKNCGGAIIAKPNDRGSIGNAVMGIMSASHEQRLFWGKLCGEFAEAHNFNTFSKEFLSELDNLVLQKEKQK